MIPSSRKVRNPSSFVLFVLALLGALVRLCTLCADWIAHRCCCTCESLTGAIRLRSGSHVSFTEAEEDDRSYAGRKASASKGWLTYAGRADKAFQEYRQKLDADGAFSFITVRGAVAASVVGGYGSYLSAFACRRDAIGIEHSRFHGVSLTGLGWFLISSSNPRLFLCRHLQDMHSQRSLLVPLRGRRR